MAYITQNLSKRIRKDANEKNFDAPHLLLVQSPCSEHHELVSHFEFLNYHLEHTEDVSSALALILDQGLRPDVILVDMPELSKVQLGLFERVENILSAHEWVFCDYDLSHFTLNSLGAWNARSISQPSTIKQLEDEVAKAVRSVRVKKYLQTSPSNLARAKGANSIVGNSDVITRYKQRLSDLSKISLSALMIKGETGSGKGYLANLLHNLGSRSGCAFVEMNCAALPKDLVESQLFGHEAGAFTGAKGRHRGLLEQADLGTLFLDEICEMPLDTQAKLLKAIEEQRFRRLGSEHEVTVDVQIFAASNQNIEEMVIKGSFREDLFHRLNVFDITVPTLREYKSDLVELVSLIVADYNLKSGKQVRKISDDAWAELLAYDWPGNIRELKNALERGVLMSVDDWLSTAWLNLNNTLLEQQLNLALEQSVTPSSVDNVTHLRPTQCNTIEFTLDGKINLEEMDQKIIECALKVSDYNISQAAQLIGTTRETLRYRIQKYHLDISVLSA